MIKAIDYKNYKKPSDFVQLDQGDTILRIVSGGGLLKKHSMKTARGFIPMGDCTEDASCEQCIKGNEPKQKWVWIAYINKTKSVRVLEAGPMLGDQICKLAQYRSQDPKEFDLVINKIGTGFGTKYKVGVGDVFKLTKEQEDFIEPVKAFLIKKHFNRTPKVGQSEGV